jgi:hypothetical protein
VIYTPTSKQSAKVRVHCAGSGNVAYINHLRKHMWPLSRSANPLQHRTLGVVLWLLHQTIPYCRQKHRDFSLTEVADTTENSCDSFRVKKDGSRNCLTLTMKTHAPSNFGDCLPVDTAWDAGRLQSSLPQIDAHNFAWWTGKERSRILVKESPVNYVTLLGWTRVTFYNCVHHAQYRMELTI